MKKYNLPSNIFNFAETALVFICGLILKLNLTSVLSVMVVYLTAKILIGAPKHYKRWRRCAIACLSLMTSLFLVARESLYVGLLACVICAFATSDRADIYQFAWKAKGEPRKHQRFIDYVSAQYRGKEPPNAKLQEFEARLKGKEEKRYWTVYRRIFVDAEPPKEVETLLDIDSSTLSRLCDKIVLDYAADYTEY